MKITEPKSKLDFESYYELRWQVLRKPWDQPKGSEKDDLEDKSIHLMACAGPMVIGVARAHFNSANEAQIRYMAVDKQYRGRGVGTNLLKELEKRIRQKGATLITLNARETAVGFYEDQDYQIVAKSHTLYDSIEHFKMAKNINPFGIAP